MFPAYGFNTKMHPRNHIKSLFPLISDSSNCFNFAHIKFSGKGRKV